MVAVAVLDGEGNRLGAGVEGERKPEQAARNRLKVRKAA